TLTSVREGHTVAAIGGRFFYVFGGSSAGAVLNTVERATINADGSLGTFAKIPDFVLITSRNYANIFVTQGGVFVVGGNSGVQQLVGSDVLHTLERAPINADSTIGVFENISGNPLTDVIDMIPGGGS